MTVPVLPTAPLRPSTTTAGVSEQDAETIGAGRPGAVLGGNANAAPGAGVPAHRLRFLSVCSGIEAASVAWEPMGWRAHAFAEIEPFPAAVLAHHYPGTPNWGDMTRFRSWPDADVSLLVGGTPCQSFSVAGLRKGLDDPRGNLALVYLAIADRYRPRWLVWENVPGVLSSNGGRDFGAFLGGLGQLGYGFAYRVLDAQYIRTRRFRRAVPQRRRRVFVVGYLGDWRRAAAVLFDRESLSGNPPPRREAGQGAAPGAEGCAWALGSHAGAADGDQTNRSHARGGPVGLGVQEELAYSLRAGRTQSVAHSLRGEGFDASEDGTGRGTPLVPVVSDTLVSNGDAHSGFRDEKGLVPIAAAVRRLTPRECERLQGFPDDYTLVPYRGKPASDGPRYKALGNSMAVNVMSWLGERIALVDALPVEVAA